jgi:outer membrane protein assembly factor BamB
MRSALPLPSAILVLAAAVSGAAADWPQFRGPNGSGVYSGPPLPITFGPKATMAWSAQLPFGRSSPIVFENRLFVTAADGERLLTLCFDRVSGRLLWRHEATRRRVDERIDRLNDPASPTPAADSTGVYVFFPDLGLLALDHSGRERWRLELPPFSSAYGMASSPIVVDGIVVLACDQQVGSYLLAVEGETGRVRWRVERPEMREGWFTPVIHRGSAGRRTLVVPGSARIEGFDLETGGRLWAVSGSKAENLGVPLIDGDRVYVNVRGHAEPVFPTWLNLLSTYDADKDGRVLREEVRTEATYFEQFNYADTDRDGYLNEAEWTRIRDAGVGRFGLMAIRLDEAIDDSSVLWRLERNVPYVPAPLLYDGLIYMVKSGGIASVVDPATGTLLKQARLRDALGDYFASPVAGDGKVYSASAEGKITVLDADRDLRVLAVNDLEDAIYATPALVDGAVYVRTGQRLYCFRLPGD